LLLFASAYVLCLLLLLLLSTAIAGRRGYKKSSGIFVVSDY